MALIAVAADKGAPGVTTTATALAAVWPRPVVLAECDPAGGDIVYRLPGAHGGRLDPRRGLLSLAVAARHGLEPGQVWQHAQRLRGGLDVLAGVGNAEQGSGIEPLWGPVGGLLAALPGADVIADCGRLGPDGPYYDLLAQAAIVVLIIRPSLGEVLRLRDRVAAVALAVGRRGGHQARIGVLVVADRRGYRRALAEVGHAVGGPNSPVGLLGGIAFEPKSAQRLRGEWGGRLDRSLLIRTARDAAAQLAAEWPAGAVRASSDGLGAAAGTQPARAWDQQRAHHPDADRAGPPWSGPAWPGSAPGPSSGARPLAAHPAAAELGPARVTAARLAADQLTAAELTAAQVAAARLGAAQAAADHPAAAPSGPLSPGSAQPDRAWRGALRPGSGRAAGRGSGRSAGRGASRGRHAGGPAQPAADAEAPGPGNGRARPRGW